MSCLFGRAALRGLLCPPRALVPNLLVRPSSGESREEGGRKAPPSLCRCTCGRGSPAEGKPDPRSTPDYPGGLGAQLKGQTTRLSRKAQAGAARSSGCRPGRAPVPPTPFIVLPTLHSGGPRPHVAPEQMGRGLRKRKPAAWWPHWMLMGVPADLGLLRLRGSSLRHFIVALSPPGPSQFGTLKPLSVRGPLL